MKMIINTINLGVVFLTAVLISGCAEQETHQEEARLEHSETEHNEHIQITAEALHEFDIKVDHVSSGELRLYVALPGEIIVPPDNLAHVQPRFPGIVKQVYKHIGDPVKKGELLAIIEGNESLVEYNVHSLIDGTLIEKHLSMGEVVGENEHGFVIADLDRVWAMLKLYQKDLMSVKKGQEVVISAGVGMPEVTAKVNYISPIIDESTRTATVRVELDNLKREWKPGLFITGKITVASNRVAMRVPQSALLNFEGETIVFSQQGDEYFPQPVTLGKQNLSFAEIISGLAPGQAYVSEGGFILKAELQKASFGGHVH